MNRDAILVLLSSVGILTAVAGAISQKVAAMEWALPLIGTSVGAFWGAFATFVIDVKRNNEKLESHYSAIESRLTVIQGHLLAAATAESGPGTTIERGILLQLLRAGAFSRIDAELWARFGSDLLGDTSKPDAQKLADVTTALQHSRIEVAGRKRAYSYMHTLLRSIHRREQKYRAITTPHELAKDEAKDFVLQLSKRYPGTIQRILVVPNQLALKDLSSEVRSALREVNDVVAMRYLVMVDEEPRNFGIYGEIAVGVLDEKTDRNSFIFRTDVVGESNNEFITLWDAASRLDDSMLSA